MGKSNRGMKMTKVYNVYVWNCHNEPLVQSIMLIKNKEGLYLIDKRKYGLSDYKVINVH
jgi:hypothetical protein